MKVKKRNGELEDFSAEKLNEVVVWACKDLEANPSDIVMNAKLQLYNGIKTSKIHEVLINSSANLINIKNSDYQWSTSRLLSFFTRKQLFDVFKDEDMPSIEEVFDKNVKLGFYDPQIIKKFTEDELEQIEGIINHSNDNLLTYASYKKMLDSYVVKNRVTGYTYETPQYSFIVIAMTLENTVEGIRNLYNSLVNKSISFPTPIMAGVRTNSKQYASCVLIDSGDDLDSIYASAHAIGRFVSRKAGIGLNFGRWRALGSSIRKGEVFHTGVIPFLRLMQSSVKSCSQGGVRDGSATTNYPIWHPEVSDLLVLKNNKGTDDNRVKNLDYSVQLTGFFLKRMLKNEKISLFSTSDAPELIELWGLPEFDEVYLKYEANKKVKRTEVDGQELLLSIATERLNTGRLYISFIDNVNATNQFKEKINMTNLCLVGTDRVVTNEGYLKAEDLYNLNKPLTYFDGNKAVEGSEMKLREENVDVYKVTLENGLEHTITDYHSLPILTDRNKIIKTPLKDLKIGDKIAIQVNKGIFGNKSMEDEAFLLGLYQSDGTQTEKDIMIDVWENDFDLLDEIKERFDRVHYKYGCDKIEATNQTGNTKKYKNVNPSNFHDCTVAFSKVKKKRLASRTLKKSLSFEKGYIPKWIWESDEKTQWQYVRGLMYADGSANISKGKGDPIYISYVDINEDFCKELQILFNNLGLQSSIRVLREAGKRLLPDGKGGQKYYNCKKIYRLLIGNKNSAKELEKNTQFLSRKGVVLEDKVYRDNSKKAYKILSIDYVGKEDVYCPTIFTTDHIFISNGFKTFNCVEICEPTSPIKDVNSDEGEIALCNLGGLNLGSLKGRDTFHLMEKPLRDIVRALDTVIDIQEYPVKAAEKQLKRRSIGVGVTNFAYWMAKNGLKYEDEEALPLIDELFEHFQYYLIKASMELAKERGACEWFDKTKYAQGIMPFDNVNEEVKKLTERPLTLDWNWLREEVKTHGMRNSVLSAQMPVESSSMVNNSTNGIEPPRELVTVKTNKSGASTIMVVPEGKKLASKYTLAWDIRDNSCVNKITAVIQKWLDQAISVNHYYNPTLFEGNQIPAKVIIKDIVEFYKLGGKNLYYANTLDAIEVETEDCESCKL